MSYKIKVLLFHAVVFVAIAITVALYMPPYAPTVRVPILMYHHIDADPVNEWVVTPEAFALQMRTLRDNGFTAITLCRLVDFVDYGIPLPERPIVITFDDGYRSMYEYAFPILQRYGMVATNFIIGHAVGMDTYKDTGHPVIPRFCYAQARAMAGVVYIQSHSHDMHQAAFLEPGRPREYMLRWPDESEADFTQVLIADHRTISAAIYAELGKPVFAVAFPHGIYDDLTQAILYAEGVRVTLGTRAGINRIIYGVPESLLALHRFNITDDINGEGLLRLIG
ncbi:MAG: polysaccharide deacetylase family protein [Defluviitaleaceae bacterium]|nr:polysaccharide deacetylase family protein [Defluviitaleaceae bacterium]MCL2240850.1 polysaccharide deacetylase family protein [Defluviitaleaceae bacterium]